MNRESKEITIKEIIDLAEQVFTQERLDFDFKAAQAGFSPQGIQDKEFNRFWSMFALLASSCADLKDNDLLMDSLVLLAVSYYNLKNNKEDARDFLLSRLSKKKNK